MSKRKILCVFAVALLSIVGGFCSFDSAFAASSFNTIKAKAALEGVYQCFYGDYGDNSPYYGYWDFDGKKTVDGVFVRNGGRDDTVKLPYGLTDANDDNNTNCKQVLFGFGSFPNISGDELNKGLLPEDIQTTYDAVKIRDYFAGASGSGGSGSMNYVATVDSGAGVDSGSEYNQLSLSVSECMVQDAYGRSVPVANPKIIRSDGSGNRVQVDAILFPAVAAVKDGRDTVSVVVGNIGYNVPVPGSHENYYYELQGCGITVNIKDSQAGNKNGAKELSYSTSFSWIQTVDGRYKTGELEGTGQYIENGFELGLDSGITGEGTFDVSILKGSVSEEAADSSFKKVHFDWENNNNMNPIKKLNDTNKIGYKVPGLTDSYESLALTEQEVYDLYKYYLKSVYKVPVACEGEANFDGVKNDSSSKKIKWASGKECYAYLSYSGVNRNPGNVYGVGPLKQVEVERYGGTELVYRLGDTHFKYTITLDDVIDALSVVDLSKLEDTESGGTIELKPDNTADVSSGNACYSGSGVVGWLVCPLIKMISGIGNSLWGTIEQSFMIIPAEIFSPDNGVMAAWGVIRNIGNIFFIILFMIVIFSQLTGVGIDNYGIKKILPKLILVAVLANLSWIICELAVDVSNIVGSGISGLLTNVATSVVSAENNASTLRLITGGVGDVALVGGGAALFVLLNGWNLAGLAALGLAVLGVVISLVSGIIVMYIILIVRQAGVILLIALSPLAIVCYALPNTEKMFKKWRDLFKALLVVYPLCGAALGAGRLASAVLASIAGGDSSGLLPAASAAISAGDLGKFTSVVFAAENNGSTGLMLAAMIVQVLPFFFIPKLLKSSLSLMGNIGEKISRTGRSLGRRASNTLQSGIKNSNRFKDFQQYQSNQSALRRAKRTHNRYTDGNGEALAGLSKRQKDRLAKANAVMLADSAKEKKTDLDSSKLGFNTNLSHQELAYSNEKEKMMAETFANKSRNENEEALGEALDGDDAEYAAALTKTVLDQGGEKQVLDMLMNNDKWSNGPLRKRMMLVLGNSKLDALRSYNKYLSTGGRASFSEWVAGNKNEGILKEESESNAAGKTSIKDMSYADHLSDMGIHSMGSYTKDEMQFVRDHAAALSGQLGVDNFGQMVGNAAVNSKDAKAQTVAESIIRNGIANGTMSGKNLGFTAADIGNMRDETADAIYNGYRINKAKEVAARTAGVSVTDDEGNFSEEKYNALDDEMKKSIESAATADMRKAFDGQIKAINKDNRIRNKTRSGVKNRFGIIEEGGSPTPPPRVDAAPVGGGPAPGGGDAGPAPGDAGPALGDAGPALGGGSGVITAIDELPAEIPAEIRGKSYEEVGASDMPKFVSDKHDYTTYVNGMEARKKLSEIGEKSYVDAVKDGTINMSEIKNKDQFDVFKSNLRKQESALDDLRIYHAIKGKSYADVQGDLRVLTGAKSEDEFIRFRDDLQERVEGRKKTQSGDDTSGSFDVPR